MGVYVLPLDSRCDSFMAQQLCTKASYRMNETHRLIIKVTLNKHIN